MKEGREIPKEVEVAASERPHQLTYQSGSLIRLEREMATTRRLMLRGWSSEVKEPMMQKSFPGFQKSFVQDEFSCR